MIEKIFKHFLRIRSEHKNHVGNNSVKFSQILIFLLGNLCSKILFTIEEFNFEFHFVHPLLKSEFTLIFLEMMLKSLFEK